VKIFLGVINDVIRSDGADLMSTFLVLHYGGYMRTEGFWRFCTAKVADASGGAVDQDSLSRLNMPLVTKTLQRGERRYG